MTRPTGRTAWLLAVALAVTLSAGRAECQGVAGESRVEIHGFGGWAAGYTDNDNLYPDWHPVASNDLEVNNAYFTLNLLARPGDRFVIHAQPTWETTIEGQEVTLDLAYVEVTLVDDLFLRAGKIRNPLGLYTEIYKVGTLRPFYLLPNGYYRLAPESYSGVGLNRLQPLGDWELELELLGGQMNFLSVPADTAVDFDPEAGVPIYASILGEYEGRKVLGGGALVRPPVAGLELGFSFYSLELYASFLGLPKMELSPDERQKAYAASLEYLTDKISLRSEALLLRGYEVSDVFYVEAAYHLDPHWQVAALYDYKNTKEPEPVNGLQQLVDHESLGAALNYWVSPNLAWKLNYYHVKNNRAARPSDAVNNAIAGTLDDTTNVVVFGVNFAF